MFQVIRYQNERQTTGISGLGLSSDSFYIPCLVSNNLLNKWDKRFLRLSREVSGWSKDPSTQVGAVITRGKHIVSLGFNGFPPTIEDKSFWLSDREIKLKLIIHGEINAIINAKGPVDGCTLYTYPLAPCNECAKFIAACNIKRVVSIVSNNPRWIDSLRTTEFIFEVANIQLDLYWEARLND